LVIGTTGIDEGGRKKLVEASRRIPIVFSPNMSLSANVLFDVVERVAALLPGDTTRKWWKFITT
jgi:4-hydroxy-tetrahydrodipicolinate reductase